MDSLRRLGARKFLGLEIGLADDSNLPVGSTEDIVKVENELNFLVHIGKLGFNSVNDYAAYIAYEFQTLGVVYKDKSGINVTAMFPMFRGILLSQNANKNSKLEVHYGDPELTYVLPIGGFKGLFFE